MDGMDMSSELNDNKYYNKYIRIEWTVIGVFIFICSCFAFIDYLIGLYRLKNSSYLKRGRNRAKPYFFLLKWYACIVSIGRQCTYLKPMIRFSVLPKFHLHNFKWVWPSIGRIILISSYFSMLMGIFFYERLSFPLSVYEQVAYKAAHMAIGIFPLVMLLANKNSIVSLFLNSSHERLNFFHRWISRGMFLMATIHMGFFLGEWDIYKVVKFELEINSFAKSGIIAWSLLAWNVVVSTSIFRSFSYEFFLINHIASSILFLVYLFIHVPSTFYAPLYIGVGFWAFDRALRLLKFFVIFVYLRTSTVNNISTLNNSFNSNSNSKSNIFPQAIVTSLPSGLLIVSLLLKNIPKNKFFFSWSPGQFVYVYFPTLAIGQSHPFTISSLSSDKKVSFIIRPTSISTKKSQNTSSTFFSNIPKVNTFSETSMKKFLHYVKIYFSWKGVTTRLHNHVNSTYKNTPTLPISKKESNSNDEFSFINELNNNLKLPSISIPISFEGPYGASYRDLKQFSSVVFFSGGTGCSFTLPITRDILHTFKHALSESSLPPVTNKIVFSWTGKCLTDFFPYLEGLRDIALCVHTINSMSPVAMSNQNNNNNPLQEPIINDQLQEQVYDDYNDNNNNNISLLKSSNDKKSNLINKIEVSIQINLTKSLFNSEMISTEFLNPNEDFNYDNITNENLSNKVQSILGMIPLRPEYIDSESYFSDFASSSEEDSSPDRNLMTKYLIQGFHIDILSNSKPNISSIINTAIIRSPGESAVVVSGPSDLCASVSNSVVKISDQRAVNTGSGAQGIYLFSESYSF